jgi:hypothetical protein
MWLTLWGFMVSQPGVPHGFLLDATYRGGAVPDLPRGNLEAIYSKILAGVGVPHQRDAVEPLPSKYLAF